MNYTNHAVYPLRNTQVLPTIAICFTVILDFMFGDDDFARTIETATVRNEDRGKYTSC